MLRHDAILTIGLLLLIGAGCHGPRQVAELSANAHLLGAFHGRVYWIDDGLVSWIDDGSNKRQQWRTTGSDWSTRSNFAVDATGSYFSHHNRLSHLDADPTPGTWRGEPSLDGWTEDAGEHPSGAAIDESCAYAIDSDVECESRGIIVAVPKQKGAPRWF
jgi:hypothetical protein